MKITGQFRGVFLSLGILAFLSSVFVGQTPPRGADAFGTAPAAGTQTFPPSGVQNSISPPSQGTETPATPPKVSYQGGLLTIRAENSTLGDVLAAVQRATGATIDSPGYASERVYVNLGPGEPRNVIASLLNGSRYDYILVGSAQQPNAVSRVMLTIRQNIPATTAVAGGVGTPQPRPGVPVANTEESDSADESADTNEPEQIPGRPIPPPQANSGQPSIGTQPGVAPVTAQQQQNGQQNPGGQQVKTPEQLLQQLQQMQQQQQQQMQLQQQLQQQNNSQR